MHDVRFGAPNGRAFDRSRAVQAKLNAARLPGTGEHLLGERGTAAGTSCSWWLRVSLTNALTWSGVADGDGVGMGQDIGGRRLDGVSSACEPFGLPKNSPDGGHNKSSQIHHFNRSTSETCHRVGLGSPFYIDEMTNASRSSN